MNDTPKPEILSPDDLPPDQATIANFLEVLKAQKIKDKTKATRDFSLPIFLRVAMKNARPEDISLTSHPAKFTHPDAKTTPVLVSSSRAPDGFLRSGNVEVNLDATGDAARVTKPYQLLTFKLFGKKQVYEHLLESSPEIQQQLAVDGLPFAEVRDALLEAVLPNKDVKTDDLVKQVYFPIANSGYHLLSVLTPSGLICKMKSTIDKHHFSDDARAARNARKNNEYHASGVHNIHGLTKIGFGGANPQNISPLNAKVGKPGFYLLPSMPPQLAQRAISPPKRNFFSDTLWPGRYKNDFQRLHKVYIDSRNNIDIRNKRDQIVQDIIYRVIETVWLIREVDARWSESDNYQKLPKYQKIWLDQLYEKERLEDDAWLDDIIAGMGRWLVNSYEELLGIGAPTLGDDTIEHFKSIASKMEPDLR